MKKTLFIICLFFAIDRVWSIDPQFTQFYSAPLYLSPSYAGATQQNRLSTNYRKQWVSIPGAFSTFTFAYDRNFSNYNSGVGLLFLKDQAGSGKLGFSYFSLLYSYDVRFLGEWHFRPGMSLFYQKYNLDFNRLRFYDQLTSKDQGTTETPPAEQLRGNIDGSLSGLVYNNNFWVGMTVDHILKPTISFFGDTIPGSIKYTVYGGFKYIKRGRLLRPATESISFAYLFKSQGDFKQLDLGLYWFKSPLVFGFWYRGIPVVNKQRGDAVAFLVGFKLEQFSIGYSYDFTISNLINSTSGSHEFSLIYEFQVKTKKKYRAIPCPEF